MALVPIPFDDSELDVFWQPEEFDEVLPPAGFITDMVTALRGVETPTKTALWSAIFSLSCVLKRDSYIEKYPLKVFPNFFIIVIGPPRIVAKSTAVGFSDEHLLVDFHEEYEDPYLQKLKRVNLLRSRATPEALSLALEPEVETVVIDHKIKPIDRGSQLSLIISELATFMGKQKYNIGLITKLIQLYDCKSFDDDLTVGRGNVKMRKVYVTLFGATTRDGFENSVATDALGDGFMSRVVLVHTPKPTRCFPDPKPPTYRDGEVIDWPLELRKRLAWVAANAIGEYVFTPEARTWYNDWYGRNHKALTRRAQEKESELRGRLDVHLEKLALIIRAQRYVPGRTIELEDVQAAHRILMATYEQSFASIENALATTDEAKWHNRVITMLKDQPKGLTQKYLLQHMSSYQCRAPQVRKILKQLNEEGRLEIKNGGGKPKSQVSVNGKELYKWKKGLKL